MNSWNCRIHGGEHGCVMNYPNTLIHQLCTLLPTHHWIRPTTGECLWYFRLCVTCSEWTCSPSHSLNFYFQEIWYFRGKGETEKHFFVWRFHELLNVVASDRLGYKYCCSGAELTTLWLCLTRNPPRPPLTLSCIQMRTTIVRHCERLDKSRRLIQHYMILITGYNNIRCNTKNVGCQSSSE